MKLEIIYRGKVLKKKKKKKNHKHMEAKQYVT